MITYSGKLIRLRPLCLEDQGASFRWRNDPEIRDFQLGYRFPITKEMENKWVEKVLMENSGTRCIMAIEDLNDDKCVGFIHLIDIDWVNQNTELGITIGEKNRHGKGLAQEAINITLRHAFKVFGLHKVWVRVASFNIQGMGLFEKTGFKKEGELTEHIQLNAQHHDLIIMGILAADFLARDVEAPS
jgi:RimJ/RimL family protein N-acetyltransferase